MSLKSILIIILGTITIAASGQQESTLNQTDSKGRKQGHWIKRNPDESILYEGFFRDDHPVGEFKRYYPDKAIKSILNFSANGKEATAILYHPNGYVASKGKYVNQKKEGRWQFFSEFLKDGLLSEEYYSNNQRNGLSVKYYPDSTIAEKTYYVGDVKDGEWTRYYQNGSLLLKSQFNKGKLEGKFETWFENGNPEFSGQYRNDARDGLWLIYNQEGKVRYRLNYEDGITHDRQMDIDQAKILDEREKTKEQIEDPEKKAASDKP